MTEEITIHGYPNGTNQKPRVPMVHILASGGLGDVQSISFHPIYAQSIANSILRAAKAAKAGRTIQPIKIKCSDHPAPTAQGE